MSTIRNLLINIDNVRTISSAYIMTTAMKGNSGASLFNCTVGNFLGVFVTPAWLLLFLATDDDNGAADGFVFCFVIVQLLLF
jgi:predicted Na+-dependent transporter